VVSDSKKSGMNRPKLLIVDDEKEFTFTLAERLRLRNYHTKVAADGEAALEEIRKERPDIVLLDLHIPGMSGLEILTNIKANDASIEVIIVTGSVGDIGDVTLQAGAHDYMIKPVDIENLLEKLQEIQQKRALE
jgi:two-component system response regulator CpxR